MGRELELWNAFKSRIESDATLTASVKKIIWGNREMFISENTQMPILFFEISNIFDTRAQVPKRSQFNMIIQIRAKLKSLTEDDSISDALTLDEKIKNAIEGIDPTLGGKIVAWNLETESFEKLGDEIREIVLKVTYISQPFVCGNR